MPKLPSLLKYIESGALDPLLTLSERQPVLLLMCYFLTLKSGGLLKWYVLLSKES
jgi:hypothetical protein